MLAPRTTEKWYLNQPAPGQKKKAPLPFLKKAI